MDKQKKNFLEPDDPFVIVRKITKEIIEETIQAYAGNDAYWLKFYHFEGEVDMAVFNKLQAEHIEELKELDELFFFQLLIQLGFSNTIIFDAIQKYTFNPVLVISIFSCPNDQKNPSINNHVLIY